MQTKHLYPAVNPAPVNMRLCSNEGGHFLYSFSLLYKLSPNGKIKSAVTSRKNTGSIVEYKPYWLISQRRLHSRLSVSENSPPDCFLPKACGFLLPSFKSPPSCRKTISPPLSRGGGLFLAEKEGLEPSRRFPDLRP